MIVSAQTPGTLANTTGTLLTAYPTQAFPMTLSYGGNTIWAANFYLTMMGTADDYSIGPCPATANCIGSGLPNPVAWDTVKVPNFLERQGGALSISGGLATQGPPFGSTVNYLANVSVSFTPVPNKLAAPVVFPAPGLPRRERPQKASVRPVDDVKPASHLLRPALQLQSQVAALGRPGCGHRKDYATTSVVRGAACQSSDGGVSAAFRRPASAAAKRAPPHGRRRTPAPRAAAAHTA